MSAATPSPGPLAGESDVLERRYRRLLDLYPPSWRAARLEEVLAVLLACAGRDRQWPPVRDAADLTRHALAERMRLAGRSASRDDRRSGVALAAIVAFTLLSALSVLQLIVLAPNPDTWSAYQFTGGPGSGAGVAALASAACVVAGACWLARVRRLAILAIALSDVAFVLAALQLRNGFFAVPWPLIVGILGLAVPTTVMIVHRGLSRTARALIGPRGALELIGGCVAVAQIVHWGNIAWGSSLYGPGDANPNFHAIPQTMAVAFLAAAAVALVIARRNPVPLIASTVLSPLLLAGAVVPPAQAWLFGNAAVAVRLAPAALLLGVVALLVVASGLALRRPAPA